MASPWGAGMQTNKCAQTFTFDAFVDASLDSSSTQSVTSRLETSRYRDFSQFFESIGLGLENFGLEKKSRYRSRKYLVSKKSLGIGLENIWSRKKVSVSVSKTLVSKKVSVSVSKILVSKKVSVTT